MNSDRFAFLHCLGLLLLAPLINGYLDGSGGTSSGNEPGLQYNVPNHSNVPNEEDNTPSLDITIDDQWRLWPEYQRLLEEPAIKEGIELPRFTISLYPVSMPRKTTAIKAETQVQADGTDLATFKLNRADWPKLKRIEERQFIAGKNGHQEEQNYHQIPFGHDEERPVGKGYELAIQVNRTGQVILRQLDLYEKQEQEYTFSILPEDITQAPLEELNLLGNLGPKLVQHEVNQAESLNIHFNKLIQRGEKCVQLTNEAIEKLTQLRVSDFALEQQYWENTWRRLYLKYDYIKTLSSSNGKELSKINQKNLMNLEKSIEKELELLNTSQKNFLNCRNGITRAQGWAREQTDQRIKMLEAKRPPNLCFRPGEFYRFQQAERQRNEQIFQNYYGQAMATIKLNFNHFSMPTTGQGQILLGVNGGFPVPQYLKLKSRVLEQASVTAKSIGVLHKRKEPAFIDLTSSSHGIDGKQAKKKKVEAAEEHKN